MRRGIGLLDTIPITRFNPHPARGGMRPGGRPEGRGLPLDVSTLIPREAGCGPGTFERDRPDEYRVSTLIPREAGCDSPPAHALDRTGCCFNPHPARGGMRQVYARNGREIVEVSTLIPREAGCDNE